MESKCKSIRLKKGRKKITERSILGRGHCICKIIEFWGNCSKTKSSKWLQDKAQRKKDDIIIKELDCKLVSKFLICFEFIMCSPKL